MKSPDVQIKKLSAFIPQKRNANLHTSRGLEMLDHAMTQDGYVAPMTATADGEVIDGSARLEKATERFPDEAIVVPHDGTRPVIMVRTDIPNADDPRAVRIALAANRIAQVDLSFDPGVLASLNEYPGVNLQLLWSEEELKNTLRKKEPLDFLAKDAPFDSPASPASHQSPAAEQARIPLSIVFNTYEARRWQEYKDSIGTSDDKKALLTLLEAIC